MKEFRPRRTCLLCCVLLSESDEKRLWTHVTPVLVHSPGRHLPFTQELMFIFIWEMYWHAGARLEVLSSWEAYTRPFPTVHSISLFRLTLQAPGMFWALDQALSILWYSAMFCCNAAMTTSYDLACIIICMLVSLSLSHAHTQGRNREVVASLALLKLLRLWWTHLPFNDFIFQSFFAQLQKRKEAEHAASALMGFRDV